ncbi:MAG: hypothetical protein K6G60_05720 [Lachnospiraceae bacterium]|nr:hypothetical protein [Lachnospiraceae bacterium]
MKKKHISALAGLMALTLLLSVSPAVSVKAEMKPETVPSEMEKVAENDDLILYLDKKETNVAVYVKKSGDVWFSNPQEKASLRTDSRSQIILTYYNDRVQSATMYNYNSSITDEQFEIEKLEDGVKITYSMGEGAVKLLLPEVISVERLEAFAAKLDSSKSKKLLRNFTKLDLETMKEEDKKEKLETYPILETHSIYILKTGTKDYIKEELSEYMQSAGYTWDEYEFDLNDNGYTSENTKPWFIVPLTYRLEGANLVAEVNPDEIEYNEEGYYLIDVDILPFFGAAVRGETGYLFVPDGSGALIDFDNGSTSNYIAQVYGQDVTQNVLSGTKNQIDQSVTVKLPVFGAKIGSKAFWAVIEEGDAYADITAAVPNASSNFNNIYAGFQFLEYGESTLGDMIGSNSFQMYSPRAFSSSYKLRYGFLSGDEANYSGMANSYREYLIKKGVLKNRVTEENLPFYVEYIGAIDKSATFLGIKYRAVTAVTTYAQAKEITEKLSDSGVKNLSVIFSGWANGGLHGTANVKISNVSKLSKGGVSQKEFINAMSQKSITTYLTAEFQHVYRDKLADGYSLLGSAPKYFDRSAVKEATYFLSNNNVDKDNYISLIRPSLAGKVTKALIKSFKKNDVVGFNIGTISNMLYTDQQTENYTDRQSAKNYNSEAVKELSEAFGGRLLADNANAYVLENVTDIINVPLDSNHARTIDTPVPFYEMVLHGYMNYAGDCLNMTDDYGTTLLKSIETGSGLYFKWIYEDNSVLKETEFDDLYSVNYENWLDKAIEDYREVNEVLAPLSGQTIVKHEIVSKNVVRVTYEKGTQILVNYSKESVRVDGQTVEAGSFAVVTR